MPKATRIFDSNCGNTSILFGFFRREGLRGGLQADAWHDAADQFTKSAFRGLNLRFRFADRLFPRRGEARGLLAHLADRVFHDMELADFGAARFGLKGGKSDAKVFVLFAELREIVFELLIALGVDLELGVEMALEFAEFVLEAADVTGKAELLGEGVFPDESGDEQAEGQPPDEWVLEEFEESLHEGREGQCSGGVVPVAEGGGLAGSAASSKPAMT